MCALSIFLFLAFFFFPALFLDFFLPKPLPGIFLWKSEFDIPLFSLWCWFRIIPPLFLKQSQALLACLRKCCFSWGEGVSYHCRLPDRDNAELSTGYSDIGRKGRLSLANLLGTSPPLFLALLVPCRYLDVAVCSSWALLALWVLLSPSVRCMLIVLFVPKLSLPLIVFEISAVFGLMFWFSFSYSFFFSRSKSEQMTIFFLGYNTWVLDKFGVNCLP